MTRPRAQAHAQARTGRRVAPAGAGVWRYYLAGPMSHIPQFNFPAFDAATALLRAQGLSIVSPAEMDGPEIRAIAMQSQAGDPAELPGGVTWGTLLSRDVQLVADTVNGIIFLPGWHHSRGARLEAFVGLLCGHQFAEYCDGELAFRSEGWVRRRLL